jgi:hypothetical protein
MEYLNSVFFFSRLEKYITRRGHNAAEFAAFATEDPSEGLAVDLLILVNEEGLAQKWKVGLKFFRFL